MRRGAQAAATALGALFALFALVSALTAGAAAEQASSQPAPAAAGQLDVGEYHSCAVLPSASVRCWGYGGDGALGYGNTTSIGDDETPAVAGPVGVGPGRTATAVSAGAVHTCALLDDGSVRCWGFGANGRLGYASTLSIGDDETPGAAGPVDLGAGRTARAISAGRAHACAVLDDGSVRCWGFGGTGRLGYANNPRDGPYNIGDDETPGSVDPVKLGAGRSAKAISTGDAHTCALLDDDNVRCWGFGANGQLGYGNTDNVGDDETPGSVGPVKLGAGRKAVAISAGDFHTCALLDNGSVRCWGYAANGRLGYGSSEGIGDNETPEAAGPVNLGPGRTAKAITAGADHTCALLDNGSMRCWGVGDRGALGYGNTTTIGDDETPAAAGPVDLGAGRTAVAMSAGGDHTCARLDDGSVRCWGKGANGRLGYCSQGDIGDDEAPGTTGPVDLGVPGSPGARCAPAPTPIAQPSPPPESTSTAAPPTPPGGGEPYELPETGPFRAQARRAKALRECRAKVARQASSDRVRARGRQGSARARTLRRVKRRAAQRRRRCLKRFGRTPGRVTTPHARATARGKIVLSFRAPGTDGSNPPAARAYLIKQSLQPIRSTRDFTRAHALCKGRCRFSVTKLNAKITLTVADLIRQRTYYYSIAALDNVSGRPGPRSKSAKAKTL